MNKLVNAKYIKALFIDNIIERKIENIVVGSEVMFAYKKVIADLILLANGTTTAYEIKAQNDDLRKLENQLREYNKVFDFVYVIITENHFKRALNIVERKNGLILLTKDHIFETYRESIQNSRISKEEIIHTMTVKFILKYFKISSSKELSGEIRKKLNEKEINELKEALYTFLFDRISIKFLNFLQERGDISHYEDIVLLSMPNKRVVLK